MYGAPAPQCCGIIEQSCVPLGTLLDLLRLCLLSLLSFESFSSSFDIAEREGRRCLTQVCGDIGCHGGHYGERKYDHGHV